MEYWQKKPLLIRRAFTHFKNPLSGDDLAGLAMEEDIESRLVIQTKGKSSKWTLKRGPFSSGDFKRLPASHWTLLVQGVDRFVPEVSALLDYFNFIPQWRIDDVMISYAVEQGSVGPHYDNYDVFLFQAQGRRRWLLTTKDCIESNYLSELELRIMKNFQIEEEHILEEGDMLYLPPHVGHYGISLNPDCITYSFGYQSYKDQDLWDSFGEYLSIKNRPSALYQDPPWTELRATSQLPEAAWKKAKALMQSLLEEDDLVQDWFGCFATRLDEHADSLLLMYPEDKQDYDIRVFKQELLNSKGLIRNPLCRFAYFKSNKTSRMSLYINGARWDLDKVSSPLVEKVANHRSLLLKDILPFLGKPANETFLYELWKLDWLDYIEGVFAAS